MAQSTDAGSNSYRYVILISCSMMLALVYMSLSSWGVAVPELKETFNLSSTAIMAGSAMLLAGYSIGSFFEGRWLNVLGWRKLFGIVMALFIAASLLIPYTASYGLILLLRFIQGWGLVVVITSALVSGWFPARERGMANGILLGAIALGVALGGWLTGLLYPYGWKNVFLILAGINAAGIIIFYLTIRDVPEQVEEIEDTAASPEESEKQINFNIYTHPAMWLCGIAMFCTFFNGYGMYAFLADYLYSINLTPQQVGLLVLINGSIGVISTPVGGYVSDLLIRKTGNPLKARSMGMGIVGFLVGLVGCILVPHLAPLGITMAGISVLIAGWGTPATNGPIVSVPSDIFGAKAAGEAIGLVLLIAGAGGIISPIAVTWLASTYGWFVGWYVTAAAAGIGLIITLILPRYQRSSPTSGKKDGEVCGS